MFLQWFYLGLAYPCPAGTVAYSICLGTASQRPDFPVSDWLTVWPSATCTRLMAASRNVLQIHTAKLG